MSVPSVKPTGKAPSGSPTPPPPPSNSGGPKDGDILQVTAGQGLKVYQNVYTGKPGSSYINPSYQTIPNGAFVTSAGQTTKDAAGNIFDLVYLPGTNAVGWIEAQTKSGASYVRDLPPTEQQGYSAAQSLLTAEPPGVPTQRIPLVFQQQALSDLRSQAGQPAYLKGFVEGLGPSGMSTLLSVTAQHFDATKETYATAKAGATGTANPYETIANAVRSSGVDLNQWSQDLASQARGSGPLAIAGTRALFNQMVFDQAYKIMNSPAGQIPTGYPGSYSELCARFSYNSLNQAGIRPDLLNTINGGPNGRNDAKNQFLAAQSYGLLAGGGLTPGAIVFDPNDSVWGHVAIYAGLDTNGQPVYLTTTGWGGTDGKIHDWTLNQINATGGFFHPQAWLDLTAG